MTHFLTSSPSQQSTSLTPSLTLPHSLILSTKKQSWLFIRPLPQSIISHSRSSRFFYIFAAKNENAINS
ncbi:hypothetical protein E2C01_064932 [Portunus trituberculatus]|uniref:Uncharacterized protein n=1 Tax=Portunus trituberculatus TaxID=210409 RepID=A0A5B7HN98_PORTR|nr:hypothetical protein [Portunus trituberculatus]